MSADLAQLFDYDAAGRRLLMSRSSIKRAIRAGHLRPVRFGRRTRFTARELRRFVAFKQALTDGASEADARRAADRAASR